jgi:hypothetical protein
MSVESVIHDVASNIQEPNTSDEEIIKLHQRGIGLKKEMIKDIVPKLKSLKGDKLREIMLFIEGLNVKLNK